MNYKYLFGPVPSRRLGISLGVDLVPFKVCNFNCVYCEVGRTNKLTNTRDSYIKYADIVKELDDFLSQKPNLDYITFSGNGEPLLNSELGKIAAYLKQNYSHYKLALITNGALFYDENLINEIKNIYLLLPSLDAVSPDLFRKINRPHHALDISKIIDGLIYLRRKYSGRINLEIFIVPGLNDSPEELHKLKMAVMKIKPDLIQLNTQDRPVAEEWVQPASLSKLDEIVKFFQPMPIEIISHHKSRGNIPSFNKSINEQIIQTVKRRPSTIDDLTKLLNINRKEVNKYLKNLVEEGVFKAEKHARGIFFRYVSEI